MDYKGACHDGFCNSPSSRQFEVLYPVGIAAYLPRLGRLFPLQFDRNITEHVLYRLEHVIVLILQCQSTWPNFTDEETVQIIFKVYQEVERSVCKTWEIVTETKSGKTGRPEVSIPEDTLKLYLNYGFPKRVVAHPNQPKVPPRPKVQVTSVAPTNSNRQSVQVNIIP